MSRKTHLEHLERILNYPGVEAKKLNKYKYLIKYDSLSYILWPRSGKYQIVLGDSDVSEVYFCELKEFYHRYLTKEFKLPDNFGKVWSDSDIELVFEMIEYGCTSREIALELKRHPVSVVTRLAILLNDNSVEKSIIGDKYDVPVRELIDLF